MQLLRRYALRVSTVNSSRACRIIYVRKAFPLTCFCLTLNGAFHSADSMECSVCADLQPCSITCGEPGLQMGTQDCWMVSGQTGEIVPVSQIEMVCDVTCNIACPTTTTEATTTTTEATTAAACNVYDSYSSVTYAPTSYTDH